MDQIEFEKTISEFQKIEAARDQLWDRAKVLIEKGFEVEACILILATWNFARFRYFRLLLRPAGTVLALGIRQQPPQLFLHRTAHKVAFP